METKIENKTEQPLLARTVLEATINFDAATPSRADVRKKIAEAAKADESLVQVDIIKTEFGQRMAKVTAHVYRNKADVEKYASVRVKNRHLSKEEKEKLKAASKTEGGQ